MFRFDPIKLIIPLTIKGFFVYACMLMFVVFVIYFTLRELRVIAVQKCSYWMSYWAYIQWAILLAAYAAIALYAYKTVLTNNLMKIFNWRLQLTPGWNSTFMAVSRKTCI